MSQVKIFLRELLFILKKLFKKKRKKAEPSIPIPSEKPKKVHPWRLCPLGQHWVVEHPLQIPPSKKNPSGSQTMRHGHCRSNPTQKDHLYWEEIQEMAQVHFDKFRLSPLPSLSNFQNKGNMHDHLIQGWTQYWNDILKPPAPLDPLIVKALIASESSFNPKAWNGQKGPQRARGLMQVLDRTIPHLTHDSHELKDHFVHIREDDMENPNLSICSGIRWLFRKKELAEAILKKSISWREAVIAFKGINFNDKIKIDELMKNFDKYYYELKEKNEQKL